MHGVGSASVVSRRICQRLGKNDSRFSRLHMPARLKEYDQMVMENSILKSRTQGIGCYSTEEAIDWGITGAGLRATGLNGTTAKSALFRL